MIATFHNVSPTIQEIDIALDDLLDMLHEEDRSLENPVVCEAIEVFEQLPTISNLQGGFAIFEDINRYPEKGEIQIAGHTINTSLKICRLMEGAESIAVFVCTAGQGFSDYCQRYNQEGDYLKGYIVDTLGSVVVEKAMDYIQIQLEKMVQQKGLKITNRYSPGYCNWPVDDQKELFSLLPSNVCDISLSASCLMNPIKSVSGIIGIGNNVQKSSYSCDICNNKTCIYRKVKNKNIQH